MRIDGRKEFPEGFRALGALQKVVDGSAIDQRLLFLVLIRASQINGCGRCLDMHTKDALAIGETPQRLHVLAAWQTADFYSKKERAALAWTEAVTRSAERSEMDQAFDLVKSQFSPKEIAELTFTIVTINTWNRLNVAFDTPFGDYRSPLQPDQR